MRVYKPYVGRKVRWVEAGLREIMMAHDGRIVEKKPQPLDESEGLGLMCVRK